MCSVIRRLSRGLVRHARHHLLNNEPALGSWPLRHDCIDYTMKCRSSSTGSLWLWQALSFMMPARHTSTLFISGFRLTTNEAITTLSCGSAALRGESGHSHRKALPGPRSSASTTTPWSCSALELKASFGESSQDTRHNLAVSSVCGVSLSFNLLVCVFLRELVCVSG